MTSRAYLAPHPTASRSSSSDRERFYVTSRPSRDGNVKTKTLLFVLSEKVSQHEDDQYIFFFLEHGYSLLRKRDTRRGTGRSWRLAENNPRVDASWSGLRRRRAIPSERALRARGFGMFHKIPITLRFAPFAPSLQLALVFHSHACACTWSRSFACADQEHNRPTDSTRATNVLYRRLVIHRVCFIHVRYLHRGWTGKKGDFFSPGNRYDRYP